MKPENLEPSEVFAIMQQRALSKDGAIEDYPWEHVGWKVGGKLFGIGSKDSNVFTLKSTLEQQEALIQHPAIVRSAYVGRYGWVTITVESRDVLDIAADLLDESYDLVKPKPRKQRKPRAE